MCYEMKFEKFLIYKLNINKEIVLALIIEKIKVVE